MQSSPSFESVADNERRKRPLMFTPAEWRYLLEDASFLGDSDNSYSVPRRLMGVPVKIVPDHDLTNFAVH